MLILIHHSSGSNRFDFNETTGSPAGCQDGGDSDFVAGSLSVQPTAATISPQPGCSTNNLTKGSSQTYNEGVVDSITLALAGGSAHTECYWDMTDITMMQKLRPIKQPTTILSICR